MTAKILFFGLLATFSASQIQAQNEGRWYNVELLIFKRHGAEAFTDEHWRRDIELSYPENSVYLGYTEATETIEVRSDTEAYINLSLLAEENYQLKTYRYALTKNKNFQVLFHQAWRQQMQNKENSPAIVVSGGENIDDHKELSGHIRIHIGRYLHLTSDLWLIMDGEPVETPLDNMATVVDIHSIDIDRSWPRIPQFPQKLPEDASDNQNQQGVLQKADVLTDWQISRLTGYSSFPVTILRDQRRMRSNELHYLDHPLMGLLILFQPLEGI